MSTWLGFPVRHGESILDYAPPGKRQLESSGSMITKGINGPVRS
jgi:hypothetical protein